MISALDDFRYKREILEVLKDSKFYAKRNVDNFSHTVLAIRLMIEWKILNSEDDEQPVIWLANTKEERRFWEYQMSYWRQVTLDDIRVWTPQQIDYLASIYLGDFDLYRGLYVEQVYEDILNTLKTHRHKDLLTPFFIDETGKTNIKEELKFWVSIVTSRNHAVPADKYYQMRFEDAQDGGVGHLG